MGKLEHAPCPLGCAPNDKIKLVAQDILNDLPGEYTLVQCMTCDLLRTNPRPTPAAMSEFYPDDYGPYLGTQVKPVVRSERGWLRRSLGPLVRATWLPFYRAVFNLNSTKVPDIPVGKMLEIGCASGSYLKKMQDKGWEVQGVEFSRAAARSAQALGFDVYIGQLEQAPLPQGELDLLVGWMVLEHLHDPVSCLRKLRESAASNAWLAISVPNAASFEFALFGRRWYALQLPTHLYHFTPKTLRKMLAAAGWELDQIHHQRTLANFIASLGYTLRDAGLVRLGQKLIGFPETQSVLTLALFPLAWVLSVFGQTGRMTVWARPKVN